MAAGLRSLFAVGILFVGARSIQIYKSIIVGTVDQSSNGRRCDRGAEGDRTKIAKADLRASGQYMETDRDTVFRRIPFRRLSANKLLDPFILVSRGFLGG